VAMRNRTMSVFVRDDDEICLQSANVGSCTWRKAFCGLLVLHLCNNPIVSCAGQSQAMWKVMDSACCVCVDDGGFPTQLLRNN
jgi:hypothetical protein